MKWYIRDIIIYGTEDTRVISFEQGVNIVTGDSRTGKSALIPIVDYCFGSKDCEVPVGIIRDFAQWYAIRIQTSEEQILLARKAPGRQLTSNIMNITIGHEIEIPPPNKINANSDRKAIIDEISRRLGMMDRSLATSTFDVAFTEPPTARNVMPLLFQPQNISD